MKINLKAFSNVILHGRIFRPYYLDPETGDLFSSRCLDAKTLMPCNVSDLNPRLRLHELSGIMALSQRRGCHHGEITASA